MRRFIFIALVLYFSLVSGLYGVKAQRAKIILLIAEQNIASPQKAWWLSEINLSSVEATIAQHLIAEGFEIVEPTDLNKVIRREEAFRQLGLTEDDSIKLSNLSGADYVILGKAVASSGNKVPQSNLISCFANITAKVISMKDAKVIAYLDASSNSAHMDAISAGKEALVSASTDLAIKIINALNKC